MFTVGADSFFNVSVLHGFLVFSVCYETESGFISLSPPNEVVEESIFQILIFYFSAFLILINIYEKSHLSRYLK